MRGLKFREVWIDAVQCLSDQERGKEGGREGEIKRD